MPRKILIVFTDLHLAYSPTTLNLMAELKKDFEVKILTFASSSYFHRVNDSSVIYLEEKIKGGVFLRVLLTASHFLLFRKTPKNEFLRKVAIAKHIFKNKYERVIAVDSKALWYIKGIVKGKIDNLSLELNNHSTQLLNSVKELEIENLIIQDKRREELHENKNYKNVFFIQNAPPFYEDIEKKCLDKKFYKTLVFAGTAVSRFGIFSCVNYLNYNEDCTLKIMGAVPPNTFENILSNSAHLLHKNKLLIQNEYLNEYQYCLELSKQGIGFCFYDFFHPEIQKHYHNYFLAPSGKMFKYFASGVPVIGVDIPGLSPVKKFNAGILLKNITNEAIDEAIQEITRNYSFYVQNCFLAAREYDFKKNVQPYISKVKGQ